MKVSVERSGGFAGLRQRLSTVDTDDLPAQDRDAVTQLVTDVESTTPGRPMPDAFTFLVTVEHAPGSTNTFQTADAAALVRALTAAGATWRPLS
jgi:hypothetical protein